MAKRAAQTVSGESSTFREEVTIPSFMYSGEEEEEVFLLIFTASGSFFGTVLVKRYGRKTLMVASSAAMGMAMLCLAANVLYLEMAREDVGNGTTKANSGFPGKLF